MHFQLVRYFTVASLAMVLLVTVALVYFERQQGQLFKSMQSRQSGSLKSVQDDFAGQQEAVARRDLVRIQEAGNVNIARVFVNALWFRDFAPFLAKAQGVSFDRCRVIPDEAGADGKPVQARARRDCHAAVGAQIAAIAGFKELDYKVFQAMKGSNVFKIKVFDLRGITVYSSEHKQIGEDQQGNAGWRGAALDGRPTSEITHRDRFSAFEGVVENRDLISSYLPVADPASGAVVGVFEVYSDVTAFVEQIGRTTAGIRAASQTYQQSVLNDAEAAQREIESSSIKVIVIAVSLMLLLFGALLVIVRRADQMIRQQELERAGAQQQLAQAEKMASLGQMVAGVAHQLNTPLAFTQSNVEIARDAMNDLEPVVQVAQAMTKVIRQAEGDQVVLNIAQARSGLARFAAADVDVPMLRQMLGDVLEGLRQMSELVVNLRDFTRLDMAMTAAADLNKSLHNVVYIARSAISGKVEIREEFGALPPVECNPSQLNQVFINLINNAAQAIHSRGTVIVRSSADGDRVKVEVVDDGAGIAANVLPKIFDPYFTTKSPGEGTGLGLSIAREIVRQHGGDLTVASTIGAGSTFTVTLPVRQKVAAKP